MAKKKFVDQPVETWTSLNDKLRNADEELCNKLFQQELNGRARAQFIKRIHSRLNRVRAHRERLELLNDIANNNRL